MAIGHKTKLMIAAPVAALALAATGSGARMMAPIPRDVDFALTRTSDAGLFVATLDTGEAPLAVGSMVAFAVTLKTAKGAPVEQAAITIDGGMPQHGHGLPTKPRVTAELGGGRYRIEGVKFNMPGWWTFTVHARAMVGSDETTFNLKL